VHHTIFFVPESRLAPQAANGTVWFLSGCRPPEREE
jgi:hypothetical protein